MSRRSLIRLCLAVFFIVGALGPVMVLMQSEIKLMPWRTVALQTLACSGMGITVVLVARWRRWALFVAILFWAGVMVLNSGGLSIIFTDEGTIRSELSGPSGRYPKLQSPTDQPLTIQAGQLSAVYNQRAVLGLMAIAFVAFGSALLLRVFRKEVDHRARLETEVTIAQEIQQSLLPPEIHRTPWCRVVGKTQPAAEVGGDYFDVIDLPDGRLALCVADVTGHGVGSGILSAMTKSALLTQLRHDPSPVAVLQNLNSTVFRVSSEKTFVTFAYALIDWPNRTAQIATAGHPPVLHRSNSKVTALRTPGLALGMREDVSFNDLKVDIAASDALVFYTDGLVEATDGRMEQFGEDRLISLVAGTSASPETLSRAVFQALMDFRGREELEDDVSLLVLTFTP